MLSSSAFPTKPKWLRDIAVVQSDWTPTTPSPSQVGPDMWTRQQKAICTQKYETSRLGQVAMATARLLETHGGYMVVEDWSPPHLRERGCSSYWKLADWGCREERPGAATRHIYTRSEPWSSWVMPMSRHAFSMEGGFDASSHLTTKWFL